MQTAVVTGSSSGIGRHTARALAEQGFAVLLHGRRQLVGLQRSAAEILADFDVPVQCVTADLRSPAACRDLVQAAFSWLGTVDLWVNNAGADVLTGAGGSLEFESKLEQLLQVDVLATIRLSRMVTSRLLESRPPSGRPACVINMGWDQAGEGMEGDSGQLFCTTKSAVMAFSQALAKSVAPRIRVNCVAPGWIQTAWGDTAPDYWHQRAVRESLSERWGTPADVAATIAWLASPAADFINGQVIQVNGGRRYYPDPAPGGQSGWS